MDVAFAREEKRRKDKPIGLMLLKRVDLTLRVSNVDIIDFIIIIIVDEHLATIDYFIDFNK
jgi:hypothetical protein